MYANILPDYPLIDKQVQQSIALVLCVEGQLRPTAISSKEFRLAF